MLERREKYMKWLCIVLIVVSGLAAFWVICPKMEEVPQEVKQRETETETREITLQVTEQQVVKTEAQIWEEECQRIRDLTAGELTTSGMLEPKLVEQLFYADMVDEEILTRVNGKSYTPNDDIQLSDLSYLRMLYYGPDGNSYVGEMIVNQKIADDVLQIFQTLYENQYPIERMVLVDEYGADDEASMEENNTSAFNYRTIAGSSQLSNHSYGMAIDLNPKYNPYVRTSADGSVIYQPKSGAEYADRSKDFAYKIDEEDLAYQLFTQAGFTWGGNWNGVKDYQHFEKNP